MHQANHTPPARRVATPRANVFYALVRAGFAFTVRSYFRRIEVRDLDRMPKHGPVLIVANHPAGLTDPVILATSIKRPVHFLAMSPLFKPWLRGVFMRAVGALPVYRQRDDPALMHQNEDTFRACHEFFDRGGVVAIFPEGHSDLARRVLQLKTGAARLAIAQMRRTSAAGPITVLPVGIYFEDRTRFQSEVIVSVGEPIPLAPHLARAATEPREAVQDLTRAIQTAIESLIQIIPEPEFARLVGELERLYLPELRDRGDPRHALELKRRVAACVDHFRRTDPERVVAVARQLKHYLRSLQALDLHDAALRELEARGDWRRSHSRRFAIAAAGLPPALVGASLHWLPYEFSGWSARQIAPHPTAVSAVHMLSRLVVFPVWWGLLAAAVWAMTGWTGARLLFLLLSVVCLGVFSALFMRWFEAQPGFGRLPIFAARRRRQLMRIAIERRELVRIFDKARADFLEAEAGRTASG